MFLINYVVIATRVAAIIIRDRWCQWRLHRIETGAAHDGTRVASGRGRRNHRVDRRVRGEAPAGHSSATIASCDAHADTRASITDAASHSGSTARAISASANPN
jgi:hypothetical protein